MNKNEKLLIFLFIILNAQLFAQESGASSEPVILLETPPAPWGWITAAVLLVIVAVLIGLIFAILKKAMGTEAIIGEETRKEVEEAYVRKVKSEYIEKQKILDSKINQVKLRFSIVMSRVRTLLDTLDPEKLFSAICGLIQSDLGANRYIIFLLDPLKKELYPFRWLGYSEQIKEALIIPENLPHMLTLSLKRKQNIFRAEAKTDSEVIKVIDNKPDLKTLVAIPLCTRDRIYGVIHIESFEDGHTTFDDNESKFLVALPSFIGSAITNADIFMQTREDLQSARRVTEKEIAEKRRLHDIFSRYTSAELIENLLKNPEKIDLGGITKTAAILFTDISGFTSFSSKLTPKEVVMLMNDYLSRMTEVVLDYQGEIDKFIGDAIMARFGVLSDLPYPSRNAVEAAVAMVRELRSIRSEWAQQGRDCFDIRVGIATGPVLAGNIGSKRRQEFTVMGTTVNLASRLEAYNKKLGTVIAIDEETFKSIPSNNSFKKHENQHIRGLEAPITLYTL